MKGFIISARHDSEGVSITIKVMSEMELAGLNTRLQSIRFTKYGTFEKFKIGDWSFPIF